jgi:DNA-binding PadR family transcriptional regulator
MVTSLQLLLLALISEGVATPYDVYRRANISVGASLPALEKLLTEGFVKKRKPASRGRTQFEITAKGKSTLRSWPGIQQATVTEGTRDIEVLMRFATLAWTGNKKRVAIELLEDAAKNRRQKAMVQNVDLSSPASVYHWMRTISAQNRERAEILALRSIIRELRKSV